MTTLPALLILMTSSLAFAASPKTPLQLKCVVFDRHCDASGAVIGDKYEMSAVMKTGQAMVEAQAVTKDGRFTIKGMGITDFRGPKNPKAIITIYDSKTRTGSAAGSAALGRPANPQSDLVFVYDINSIDDSENLFCHSLEGSCEFK
jgi:hypothetical protein